jgi:hypothetical protein
VLLAGSHRLKHAIEAEHRVCGSLEIDRRPCRHHIIGSFPVAIRGHQTGRDQHHQRQPLDRPGATRLVMADELLIGDRELIRR